MKQSADYFQQWDRFSRLSPEKPGDPAPPTGPGGGDSASHPQRKHPVPLSSSRTPSTDDVTTTPHLPAPPLSAAPRFQVTSLNDVALRRGGRSRLADSPQGQAPAGRCLPGRWRGTQCPPVPIEGGRSAARRVKQAVTKCRRRRSRGSGGPKRRAEVSARGVARTKWGGRGAEGVQRERVEGLRCFGGR